MGGCGASRSGGGETGRGKEKTHSDSGVVVHDERGGRDRRRQTDHSKCRVVVHDEGCNLDCTLWHKKRMVLVG